jgi:hypothetical protein
VRAVNISAGRCKNGRVAPPRRRRPPRPARRKALGSLVEEGTELLQSVANDVAPGVVEAIDINGVVRRIDIQAVVERVDLNAALEKVDLNAILAQTDLNALLARLDLDALVDRVDMNAILERVDIDALIEQTRVGSLVARSGGAAARRVVDHLRDHGVDLDMWMQRQVDRLLRRKGSTLPTGPPLLLHDLDQGSM